MERMSVDLSKLAQPIPSADMSMNARDADGLSRLAQKLDVPLLLASIPLPTRASPSFPRPTPGRDADVVDYRGGQSGGGASSFAKEEAIRVKYLPKVPIDVVSMMTSGNAVPTHRKSTRHPAGSLGAGTLSGVSFLADSALLTPIPKQVLSDVNAAQVAPLSRNLVVEEFNAEPAESEYTLPAVPEQISDSSFAAPEPSPRRTRGSSRNSKINRKAEPKVPRAQRNVVVPPSPKTTVENWAQCENCKKWRRLPPTVDTEKLPDLWVCSLNVWDPGHNSCDVPEETFPDLKHNVESPSPVRPVHLEHNVTFPVRPVTAQVAGRAPNDRLMDHEVVELLLSDNKNHPLHDRITLHSLNKNSLLATELPHDVLVIDEVPNPSTLAMANNIARPPSELIHPDEELLKDDNLARDDGMISIGLARKTHWPSADNDASTIDSMEELEGAAEVPRSALASMFPRLASQVPKMGKMPSPRARAKVKLEKAPDIAAPVVTVKVENQAAISSMNHDDLRGLLSAFATRNGTKEPEIPPKHCLLEEKLRSCALPMDSFLQPLSMLAMPITYPAAEQSLGDSHPCKAAYASRSSMAKPRSYPTPEAASAPVEPVKAEPRRRAGRATRSSAAQSDKKASRLREEHELSDPVKPYAKKFKTSQPDADYPAPDGKRLSKRIWNRHARAANVASEPAPAPEDTANDVSMADAVSGLLMELPDPAEYTAPPTRRPNTRTQGRRSMSPFGVDMSRAIELLTQPIDLAPGPEPVAPQVTRGGRAARPPRVYPGGMPLPPVLNLELLAKPIPELTTAETELKVDVYKNPRLLSEV
ncbi:CW-type Zinc Finger protein [Babesia caballi]|uniref:CW-type Zinc Finger protein n=1 Tax=Babesia caballi TaxID=5871 RepID=A0AAV4LPH2_BABCB|nr:CW-type Zinc Finger protein [Babesia caballi]